MILSNDDAGKFPKFRKYLTTDFAQLAANTKIVDGLAKWGGFGDVGDVKRLILFGSRPTVEINSESGGFGPFNQFPMSISVISNIVKAFEVKENMEGNNKFLSEFVYLPTGRGRVFQVGLKLLELLLQGSLLVSKDTTVVPDDNVKALKVIKDRVASFENDVYGGVNKSDAVFF